MKSGHPWVSAGIVIVRTIYTDGQEAPMEPVYVIAMKAHCQFTGVFVTTPRGRPSRRGRTPTTMPALREIVRNVPRPRQVVFEEGPLAEWMVRGLLPEAERVVACNPRSVLERRLIAHRPSISSTNREVPADGRNHVGLRPRPSPPETRTALQVRPRPGTARLPQCRPPQRKKAARSNRSGPLVSSTRRSTNDRDRQVRRAGATCRTSP